jgi:hypothetical protein
MGDEILMKKLTIIVLASTLFLQAAESGKGHERIALIKDYKMMFDRIGQQRVGAGRSDIESVRPPFVRLHKAAREKVVVKKDGTKIAVKVKSDYELQAIMSKRAKISGKWYRIGDKVDDYILATIQPNGVFLQNNEFKKRLTLRKKNEKISIQ